MRGDGAVEALFDEDFVAVGGFDGCCCCGSGGGLVRGWSFVKAPKGLGIWGCIWIPTLTLIEGDDLRGQLMLVRPF